MRRYLLSLAGAMLATTALPGVASAQNAIVAADLKMRAGPSTSFPVVEVIPDNGRVRVHGCVRQYQWCDVTFRDNRGWVYADYLRYRYSGRYVPIVEYGPRIDVPIISFSFGTYWDNYYRGRPWYSRRAYWQRTWRGDRGDRAARRGDRGEDRADRRGDRREGRAERREDGKAKRAEGKREPRQEKRSERREQRSERSGDRREAKTERRQEQRAKRAEGRSDGPGTISRGMQGNRGPGRVEGKRGPGRSGPEGGRGGGGREGKAGGGRDANPGRGG